MPRAATGYRSLLRTPGAAAFFLTAAAGRVGVAMTGLGLVWLLHARTGSYGTAGLAVAGFALAAAPDTGRNIEPGPRRVQATGTTIAGCCGVPARAFRTIAARGHPGKARL